MQWHRLHTQTNPRLTLLFSTQAVKWVLVGAEVEKVIWRFNVEALGFLDVLHGNPYFQSLENVTSG